jgi:hypothetical protein
LIYGTGLAFGMYLPFSIIFCPHRTTDKIKHLQITDI